MPSILKSLRILTLAAPVTLVAPTCHASDPDVYEPSSDPGVGFNLISWWNFGGSGVSTWQNAVNDLDAAGFSEVSISPVRFINDNTGAIAQTSQQGPELSHIAAGVARAKQLGMHVTVNPFVELENFAYWRGQYNPTAGSGEWNTFWADYEDYLVDVATVAEANGADALNIGTELRTLVRNPASIPEWASVIGAVDAVFSGELGYAANWDNFNNGVLKAAIWDNPAIDYMGVDAYFTNTVTNFAADNSGTDPNESFISQVAAGWNNRLDNQILNYAGTLQDGAGLPVVLTEVGYLPYNRTAVTPQNSGGPIDTDEQVMTFKGLLRALDGRIDDVHAMHIWQWGMPGSNGSLWNINDNAPLDQPNNLPLGQFLSSFVSNPAEGIPGDFDGDGDVDTDDFGVFVSSFQISPQGGPPYSAGDFDEDGDVDTDDFGVFVGSFQNFPPPAVAVPEPGAAAVAWSALLLAAARRRR